ncbi:MAG: glycoside hydrolase family 2 [Armatimonadetes bacterium]|nr:glycoside hydrolase family 2 [Armatimonadota bacterium]
MGWQRMELRGICDSVELVLCPAVRVDDLFVRPDWKTGQVTVEITVFNASGAKKRASLSVAIAPASSGKTVAAEEFERDLPPGATVLRRHLTVAHPRLWQLNDPFLYRATVRVSASGSRFFDEHSVRFGFRDFRFADGYFRLNGKRVHLRCSHTINDCPIGLAAPHDPDLLRRDLLYVKSMGFNAIRFILGVAKRYQLDLCDEIGLLVYEESFSSWCLADSPKMAERYDASILGMVRRDRNHPSVVIWGLLNETLDGPVFRHAAALLPRLRQLDDTRMVMLNSGRWDLFENRFAGPQFLGIQVWYRPDRLQPCVTYNPTDRPISGLGITWAPGQLAIHPGADGEYAVVRWTAPATGRYRIAAAFRSIAEHATTDVHILHQGRALFDGLINVGGAGPACEWSGELEVSAGEKVDFVCGWGNGNYGGDTTALDVTITDPSGGRWHAAQDFSGERNPNGPWAYGLFAPGPTPDPSTFQLLPTSKKDHFGSLSNTGSTEWENVLADIYPRVPHTAGILRCLRTCTGNGKPLFISEYGIGSAVDLWRVVRHYERQGASDLEDAKFYRQRLERFLADWERWRLAEVFGRPEDYFRACNAKMAGQRLLGLNAIRANPAVVGHSVTGTVDQGMTGEGLFTTWREFKPGTVDALADAWAPLRLCLFAEPVNVYRGSTVHLEAVLANEDALAPGRYPIRLQVFGPGNEVAFDRRVSVESPEPKGPPEPPYAMPIFADDIVADVPTGRYRFVATFEEGAAAAGGEAEFYVCDPKDMPPVDFEVTVWGEDAGLCEWLSAHGIRWQTFDAASPDRRHVILACGAAPPPGGAEAFSALMSRVAQGSTCVFLCPEVFRSGKDPVAWLPLSPKGTFGPIVSWLYLKDEWARRPPIFDGLPCGGLMDYTFYRELIPDEVFSGQEPPAEAVCGATKASQDYASGLMVAVYEFGAGRFVLNSLLIRQNLGTHPAAERLLRNMLRFAARDLDKPPASPPAELDTWFRQFGYQ